MNKNQEMQELIRPRNILVIESDLSVRQAIGDALAAENYCAVSVANGHEALLALDTQHIGIVLVDLNPRDENFWETLAHLHSIDSDLKIIGMTARAEQQDPNLNLRGMEALIEKPLNFSNLFQALAALSSHRNELHELRESSFKF